jgi:hypothetical protein
MVRNTCSTSGVIRVTNVKNPVLNIVEEVVSNSEFRVIVVYCQMSNISAISW